MSRLALLSTYDKTDLLALARALVNEFGLSLASSGGTARALAEAGLPVTKVSELTGAPEILGGRVKTLHPKVHGGILAQLDVERDRQDLAAHGITPIALVVVNLYPFEHTIAQPGVSLAEAIEQIDIGGPTLLRAAAKNYKHVTVLSSPSQYAACLENLRRHGGTTSLEFRQALALAAFRHTQAYDRAIAAYLSEVVGEGSAEFQIAGHTPQPLRYGENPHQKAVWYQTGATPTGWRAAQKLQGKELSYNNLVDLEAARATLAEFLAGEPCAVIVKHNNPCGVAIAPTPVEAYRRAFAADAVSAFGGIVALNRPIDADTARALTEVFLECVVAPGCTDDAIAILAGKPNLRVLVLPDLAAAPCQQLRAIAGGLLVQDADLAPVDASQWQVVTTHSPSPAQHADLVFAWKVCRHLKSNAIAIAKAGVTLGLGVGQTNRVGAAQIALAQAGERAKGAVLASDGFFPFDDTVRAAAAAGIAAIVQPGGSLRDKDSVAAANELGLSMVVTGVRHFLH